MAEETNLAELLSKVLDRLGKELPPGAGSGRSLATCWAATLGGSGGGPLSEIENVARIASLLNKLKAQVQSSGRCTGAAKTWAMATLGSFDMLFSFPLLMQDGHAFRNSVGVNSLGALQGVGHAIQIEYPEVAIADQEARELSDAIASIVKDVSSSQTIPLNLRESFIRQANVITWWLSNPGSASLQHLVESAGSTMIVARQIVEDAQPRGGEAAAAGNGVYQKTLGFVKTVAAYVKLGRQGVQAAAELSHEVHSVLEASKQALS